MGQSSSSLAQLPTEFEQALQKVLHFDRQKLEETCPSADQRFKTIRDMVIGLYDTSQFKHFVHTRLDALILKHLGFVLWYLVNNVYKRIEEEPIPTGVSDHSSLQEVEQVIVRIYELATYFLSNPFLYQSLALNLVQSEETKKDERQEKEHIYNFYIEPIFSLKQNTKILEQSLRFLKELTSGGANKELFTTHQVVSSPNAPQEYVDPVVMEKKRQDYFNSIAEIQQQFALKSRGFV